MMCLVWGLSFGCTLPSAVSAQLLQISPGKKVQSEKKHVLITAYMSL